MTTTDRFVVKHNTEGLARPCNAGDMFLVQGGLQCGNCLAHNVPAMKNPCHGMASDGPCPLQAEEESLYCWIHRMQQAH